MMLPNETLQSTVLYVSTSESADWESENCDKWVVEFCESRMLSWSGCLGCRMVGACFSLSSSCLKHREWYQNSNIRGIYSYRRYMKKPYTPEAHRLSLLHSRSIVVLSSNYTVKYTVKIILVKTAAILATLNTINTFLSTYISFSIFYFSNLSLLIFFTRMPVRIACEIIMRVCSTRA